MSKLDFINEEFVSQVATKVMQIVEEKQKEEDEKAKQTELENKSDAFFLATPKFKLLTPTAIVPQRGSRTAAGLDLCSDVNITVPARGMAIVSTGIAVQLPLPSDVLYVKSRSGLAFKNGIVAFDGTVDSDYTGEVKVLLFNFSDVDFEVKQGDRIAQLVLMKYEYCTWDVLGEGEELHETARGVNGFGSTGLSAIKEENKGDSDVVATIDEVIKDSMK